MPVARLLQTQSAIAVFDADCPASIVVGDWVYSSGDIVAGVYQVAKADIADFDKLPAIGVVIEKPTTTTCVVKWEGYVDVFAGLSAHRVYYLQQDGTINVTPPPGGAGYHVQRVGVALDANVLLVTPNLHLTRRP